MSISSVLRGRRLSRGKLCSRFSDSSIVPLTAVRPCVKVVDIWDNRLIIELHFQCFLKPRMYSS